MPTDTAEPTAPVVDEIESAAEEVSSPVEETTTAPVAQAENEHVLELRNRLAGMGRELQEERASSRAVLQQQSQHIQGLTQQLQSLGQYVQRDAQARQQAYLTSLPPERRTAEMQRMQQQQIASLEQRLQQAQTRPPAQQQMGESPEQYTSRRAQEIVQEANARLGLSGGLEITGDEDELDWGDDPALGERVYTASVNTLARTRAKLNKAGGVTVATKKEEPKQPAASTKEPDAKTMAHEIEQRLRAELGVGRPLSARPAPGARASVTPDDVRAMGQAPYSSKLGPKAQIKALRELSQRAAERVR